MACTLQESLIATMNWKLICVIVCDIRYRFSFAKKIYTFGRQYLEKREEEIFLFADRQFKFKSKIDIKIFHLSNFFPWKIVLYAWMNRAYRSLVVNVVVVGYFTYKCEYHVHSISLISFSGYCCRFFRFGVTWMEFLCLHILWMLHTQQQHIHIRHEWEWEREPSKRERTEPYNTICV